MPVLRISMAGYHEHFVCKASGAQRRHLSDDAVLSHPRPRWFPSTSSFEVGSDAPVLKIVREVGNPSVARIEQRVDPFSAPMQTDNGYFIIRLQGIEVGTTTLQWTPMFIFERKGPMVRYENGLTGSSQVDVALEDPRQGIR